VLAGFWETIGENGMTFNEAIQIMTHEITAILGENALSVYIYGSVALDDFKLGWSDIDILVLTRREITEEYAETLVRLRQALLERYPGNPYFRSFEGGMRSLDAFLASESERTVYWGQAGSALPTTTILTASLWLN
jgi:predicted nucleotidyltransferase